MIPLQKYVPHLSIIRYLTNNVNSKNLHLFFFIYNLV